MGTSGCSLTHPREPLEPSARGVTCQGGSFESVFTDYSPRVEAFCRHVFGDSQDVDDAIEETFPTRPASTPSVQRRAATRRVDRSRRAAAVCGDFPRVRRRND
jgi:hypothetical protein